MGVLFSPRRPVRLGLTAPLAGQALLDGLWASGMTQNIVYLAMLFQRMPGIEPCLVVPDDQAPGEARGLFGLRQVPVSGMVGEVDVLVETGVRFAPEVMARFREGGGKLVSYMAGNAMVMNLECLANGTPYGELPSEVGYDACWITPQHMKTNAAYAALTRTPAVFEAPHVWHPHCLLGSLESFGADRFFWQQRDAAEPWRLGVFDPTVNVVKTFHIPLLVCEEAARRDPAQIAKVLLFSADRFIGNPHFEQLVAALDLGRAGKVFAEARHPLASVLGRHVDAVVTHQWENSLNYLYWDVLYSGRPLIHNAPALGQAGYYFPDFDTRLGGRVLAEALRDHGRTRVIARDLEREVLWEFNLENPVVQAAYEILVHDVMETAA